MQQQLQLSLLPAYQSARWACIAMQTCSSQRAHFPRISLLRNFINSYDTYHHVASHPSPPFSFCSNCTILKWFFISVYTVQSIFFPYPYYFYFSVGEVGGGYRSLLLLGKNCEEGEIWNKKRYKRKRLENKMQSKRAEYTYKRQKWIRSNSAQQLLTK